MKKKFLEHGCTIFFFQNFLEVALDITLIGKQFLLWMASVAMKAKVFSENCSANNRMIQLLEPHSSHLCKNLDLNEFDNMRMR
jgi:hypothetical protein